MRFWHDLMIPPARDWLEVAGRRIALTFVRNGRARRYVLRLRPDGTARVTVPRGGTVTEARRFAERSHAWIETQLKRPPTPPPGSREWRLGSEVWFRGELVRLESGLDGYKSVLLGSEEIPVTDLPTNLRPAVEQHLRRLAERELPPCVQAFAALHQLAVRQVTVRNQRSRWGSCSRYGTISLNWRLVQTPPFVRDYIILHELMHLREMNHSARFWHQVERVCPDYAVAERWLKQYSRVLRQ